MLADTALAYSQALRGDKPFGFQIARETDVNSTAHGAIDAENLGAIGFSAGGLTALTVAGAQPDMALIARQCCRVWNKASVGGPWLPENKKPSQVIDLRGFI